MKPIVIVENVSKKFSRNYKQQMKYGAKDLISEILGKNRQVDLRKDEFYAVKQLSFNLYPGDSLGLVGRNGSGKTTMLKMLNRLINPDSGKIITDGQIQALIALGAGFSPNLTGRQNIYNSAAVLGMNEKNTKAIIDQIIDFAELEEFIDSPVQSYSSGMYARLGFSVSVFLNPDILLIDEILAVGDYAFQNKCFLKLQELKASGKTIVLVSHNHTRVIQLCENAIWLERGEKIKSGPSKDVVKDYLTFLEDLEEKKLKKENNTNELSLKESKKQSKSAGSKKNVKALAALYGAIYDDEDFIEDLEVKVFVNDKETDVIQTFDKVKIHYSFQLAQRVSNLNVSLNIYTKDGILLNTISTLNGDLLTKVTEGKVECNIVINSLNLNPGEYVLLMPIHAGQSYLYRNVVKNILVRGTKKISWGIMSFDYEYQILEKGKTRQTYLFNEDK